MVYYFHKNMEDVYHGSGIGTKNIKAMMQQMNGLCEIKFASDYYCIILYFPIDL